MRLKDKVAIVTGVANPHGIAYASAKTLAKEGAALAIVDVTPYVHERAKELKDAGCNVMAFQVDLTDSGKVKDMVEKVLTEHGKVDILANVAGGGGTFMTERVGTGANFENISEKDFDFVVNINLKTNFNCTKAVLPSMLKQRYGKIVNISSVTGPLVCAPKASGYTAAKAAINGQTKALALEVAAYGITVNAILPSWCDTGVGGAGDYGADVTPGRSAINTSVPAKYLGKPEECADLVLFLASDESSYLNGLEVIFDGANVIQEMKTGPAYPPDIMER